MISPLHWPATELVPPASCSARRWGLIFTSLCSVLACGAEGALPRTSEPLTPAASPDPAAPAAPGATPADTGRIDENGELLLDGLNDADGTFLSAGISGEWFTYSDGTSTVTPPDHTGLAAVGGEAHVVGQGFSDWGVGVSAYFRSVDLSAFQSLILRARGSGSIVVEVVIPATSPAEEGGTCTGQGCYGHFSTAITLGDAYQDFPLPFAALTQPSWAQPAELSLAQVISVNFVAKTTAGVAAIDLWLDQLSLATRAAP